MTGKSSAVCLNSPAVTGHHLRLVMRSWPCGVAIVTAMAGGHPAGCTVNALLSVSLDPPTMLVSLAQTSRTLAAITAQRAFGISVLAWQQHRLAERFAAGPADRFAGVPYRLECGVPVLGDAMAAVACSLDQAIPAADHMLLLGRPQWCDYVRGREPAVFFEAGYYPLAVGERDPPRAALSSGGQRLH